MQVRPSLIGPGQDQPPNKRIKLASGGQQTTVSTAIILNYFLKFCEPRLMQWRISQSSNNIWQPLFIPANCYR